MQLAQRVLRMDGRGARLLDDYGVSVLAGDAFGPSGIGRVRLSFTALDAELDRGVKALGRFAGTLVC